MKKPKLVVGHLMNDQLLVKSVATSKSLDWIKGLETEELVEFFGGLLKLVTQNPLSISARKSYNP